MNITRFLALRNLFLFLTGALIISFTGCTTLALKPADFAWPVGYAQNWRFLDYYKHWNDRHPGRYRTHSDAIFPAGAVPEDAAPAHCAADPSAVADSVFAWLAVAVFGWQRRRFRIGAESLSQPLLPVPGQPLVAGHLDLKPRACFQNCSFDRTTAGLPKHFHAGFRICRAGFPCPVLRPGAAGHRNWKAEPEPHDQQPRPYRIPACWQASSVRR